MDRTAYDGQTYVLTIGHEYNTYIVFLSGVSGMQVRIPIEEFDILIRGYIAARRQHNLDWETDPDAARTQPPRSTL